MPMTIMHHRLTPKVNRFFYKTFYLCLDVSSLEDLNSALLGFQKFRPYTLRHKDYGFQDGSSIHSWLNKMIKTYGLKDHKVYLITMPRVLGYGFNPISLWLFLDEDSTLQSVIADVNNTFGENHHYLIRDKEGEKLSPHKRYEAEKVFHVSPFMPVTGTYSFRFKVPQDFGKPNSSLGLWIDYGIDGKKVLLTSMTGSLKPLTQSRLLKSLIHYPFMAILVVGKIHYQALKLWMKGISYYHKPQPPEENITE
jgi:DUF1365 family protein